MGYPTAEIRRSLADERLQGIVEGATDHRRMQKCSEFAFGIDGTKAFSTQRAWVTQSGGGFMLAKRWVGSEDVPLLAQPKLNGIRARATRDGIVMRGGGAIVALPHISAALARLYCDDPTLKLDGEIYAHGMALGEISGLARRQAPSRDGRKLAFHVFDMISDRAAVDRVEVVSRLCRMVGDEAVVTVRTSFCRSRADLDQHYADCLSGGFEGQMMRLPHAAYVAGRTNALQKRKPVVEADDVRAGWITRI